MSPTVRENFELLDMVSDEALTFALCPTGLPQECNHNLESMSSMTNKQMLLCVIMLLCDVMLADKVLGLLKDSPSN